MFGKIRFVIAVTAFAMFLTGRVGSLMAGRGLAGSAALAQDFEDQTDEAASQNDAETQDQAGAPDASDGESQNQLRASSLAYCITHPFPASGLWSGTVMDNNQGGGTISASLFQCKTKLTGTWQDTFVLPAFWKGTISSSGKVKAQMRFHITGKCGYTFVGTFQSDNEIFGTYTLHSCKGMGPDSGSFDIFKIPTP